MNNFPNEAPLYFVKGTMHRLDGEYEESLKAFEKLARLDPAARVVASYNRSRIFLYQELYDEAMRELDKGAKIEPNHPMIRIFRSSILFYRGDTDEAIKINGRSFAAKTKKWTVFVRFTQFI